MTWSLHGSLPKGAGQLLIGRPLDAGRRFVALDQQMDAGNTGPTWLRNPAVAQTVANTLFLAAERWELYELHAWVVMMNHVHALLTPHRQLRQITRAVKNTSAREANRILGRTGQPFWRDESFDRWVRGAEEFRRIARYIEWNPVNAGLVERPDEWPWSSAHPDFRQRQVGDLPHSLNPPPWP